MSLSGAQSSWLNGGGAPGPTPSNGLLMIYSLDCSTTPARVAVVATTPPNRNQGTTPIAGNITLPDVLRGYSFYIVMDTTVSFDLAGVGGVTGGVVPNIFVIEGPTGRRIGETNVLCRGTNAPNVFETAEYQNIRIIVKDVYRLDQPSCVISPSAYRTGSFGIGNTPYCSVVGLKIYADLDGI